MINIIKLRQFSKYTKFIRYYSADLNNPQNQRGTEYSNWMLSRAAGHNHSVVHLKRKYPKDRYCIHKLTSLKFMKQIMDFQSKYHLTLNQSIILLSHFNHVLEVQGASRDDYSFILGLTIGSIFKKMQDPPDLICLGTLMSSFITMKHFISQQWILIVQDILVNKFDEDFDQLFGIIVSLSKYRQNLMLSKDYLQISSDEILPKIPIIYRNSLNVVRQFVMQNVYNLKQCRLLFQAFHDVNINQGYFWNSVRDWFNIYTKQQLGKKPMQEYFIMKQNAVERVLHDHGIIRPRPILQQLSSITYILSQFGYISWKFVQFSQDLIIYAIDHGSSLYQKYQAIQKQQQNIVQQDQIKLNKHLGITKLQEIKNIKQMQRKYRTIFINPISLKDNFVIYYLLVICRAYGFYRDHKTNKNNQSTQNKDETSKNVQKQMQDEEQKIRNNKKNQIILHPRVKKWILLQLVKTDMRYTVKQLIQVQRCKQFVKDSRLSIQQFIFEKLKNLRSTQANFKQLVQLMTLIPKQRYYQLNEIISDYLNRSHPSQILKLTKYVQTNQLFAYFSQFLLILPKSVNIHYKYFSFEQNCYFLLMLLKNMQAINSVTNKPYLKQQFQGQLEQLKQSIKIVTYSRGFKILVNSYFHQIMDYIDVVDFFEGGRA